MYVDWSTRTFFQYVDLASFRHRIVSNGSRRLSHIYCGAIEKKESHYTEKIEIKSDYYCIYENDIIHWKQWMNSMTAR
jgi:hypothetical protein